MTEEDRPDPEELLRAVSQEEGKAQKGCLKIFLGMAAGVGKTYAMLEEAQRLSRNGTDIVVGTVETHGRQDTADQLAGLAIIPLRRTDHKGISFEELDIDGIIARNPELVLIDELAHSNVPGSRHPKRWQDLVEILDNGINVFTTLNVQHIESLKDVVENITGVTIRETVPDKIIESATFIELVDLTTGELLQRLKDGKVYLGDKSVQAAENFFKEDRLTALREIVLRYAAEKIDHDLRGMVSTAQRESGWKPRERLLVAVSHSPHSQKLIRTTRRLAFNLDAPWIALHVNDGKVLDDEDKAMLTKNINLARDLGAEVITTSDSDIAEAIARVARHSGVTQIIIGRPVNRLFLDFFSSFKLLDDLARECSEIDIHVIRQESRLGAERRKKNAASSLIDWSPYFTVLICVLLFSLLNWFALPFIGYKIVGFIFLLGILSLSLFFRAGPVFFASLLYAGIWGYFFIPQRAGFTEDHGMLVLYLLTAILIGALTDRSKRNKEMLTNREESARALYDIAKDIASLPLADVILSVQEKLAGILNGHCHLIVKKMDDGLILDSAFGKSLDAKEQAAAIWVFENNKEAGWSTTTLSASKNLYLPLKGLNEVTGVLSYRPFSDRELSIEEKNFLYTVCQLLANYVERCYSQERQSLVESLNKTEEVYQTILNLLAQQLEPPLDIIKKALDGLKMEKSVREDQYCAKFIVHIDEVLNGLSHSLENLSAMTKLSSGLVSINKEKHSIKDLVETSCFALRKASLDYEIVLSIPEGLPLVDFDFSLIELVVCNLIINAIENSPSRSTIEIDAIVTPEHVVVSVSDQGKGIPEEMLNSVFEKFYRIPGSTSVGLGLGLSIAKTIADIHGGGIKVQNSPKGGAKFSLYLRR